MNAALVGTPPVRQARAVGLCRLGSRRSWLLQPGLRKGQTNLQIAWSAGRAQMSIAHMRLPRARGDSGNSDASWTQVLLAAYAADAIREVLLVESRGARISACPETAWWSRPCQHCRRPP